jgi:hypothetical protein
LQLQFHALAPRPGVLGNIAILIGSFFFDVHHPLTDLAS